jgi:SAM-dependent methyltransferase
VVRDLNAFVRLHSIGALSRSGLGQALGRPGTADELAVRAGLVDVELVRALLDVGVSVGQVRRRGDRYSRRGALLKSVESGRAEDVRGLAEEATFYGGPIYANLHHHLRGRPPQPYLEGVGDAIANASRVAEPVVGPWLSDLARGLAPERVLDVGCGSAVNLRWMAQAVPRADLTGIDADEGAIAVAAANLGVWGLADRVSVHRSDLRGLSGDGGRWDLVVLAQNIYYWPVDERAAVLRTGRALVGGSGTVVAITAVPSRLPVSRNLDLVIRVTTGCSRLPTVAELEADGRSAGFADVAVHSLAPGLGMVALVASG